MKHLIALLLLSALAACGADGAPEPVEPGISVTGQIKVGVKGTL